MKTDHNLETLEEKRESCYELLGLVQGGRTTKVDAYGGGQAKVEPSA